MNTTQRSSREDKLVNIIALAVSFSVIAVIMFTSASSSDRGEHSAMSSEMPESSAPPKASQRSSRQTLYNICSQTDYCPYCKRALAPVSKDSNALVRDYLNAAVNVTVHHMQLILNLSKNLSNGNSTSVDHQALIDCNELILLGIDAVKSSGSLFSNTSSLRQDMVFDIKNWLSSAIAYQQACYDGFNFRSIRQKMNVALQSAKKMTSIALAIVNANFNINFPKQDAKTGRLLGDSSGKDYYPSWFSDRYRKLLEVSANTSHFKPDAVVAADGSGQFKAIGDALNAYKLNSNGWYVIYVKAGIYNETVIITKNKTNVYMYGAGNGRSIVSGSKHKETGIPAYSTATFAVIGNGFVCKSMTFQNTATNQEAVALRVQADKAAFFDCRIEGNQGTLHALANRQFYRECIIKGSKDFIYGDSSTVIQKSRILVTQPPTGQQFNTVTAQGRSERFQVTGIVLHNCTITHEPYKNIQGSSNHKSKIPTYLGRPWKRLSRTVIMQSYIGNMIDPAGWTMGSYHHFPEDKVFYAEYDNNGPGSNTSQRVKWDGFKVFTKKFEALQYTPKYFLQGDSWLNRTGLPFDLELL